MLAVLRRRNFAMLWLGQLVSQIGDMVLIIALPFYVYQLTGSLLQTGLMYMRHYWKVFIRKQICLRFPFSNASPRSCGKRSHPCLHNATCQRIQNTPSLARRGRVMAASSPLLAV